MVTSSVWTATGLVGHRENGDVWAQNARAPASGTAKPDGENTSQPNRMNSPQQRVAKAEKARRCGGGNSNSSNNTALPFRFGYAKRNTHKRFIHPFGRNTKKSTTKNGPMFSLFPNSLASSPCPLRSAMGRQGTKTPRAE